MFNAVFFAGLEIVETLEPLHLHRPLSEGPGRDGHRRRREEPPLQERHRPLHLDPGTSDGITTTFNIYGTDDGRKVTYTTSDFYNVVARTETTVTNPSLGPGTTVVQISGQSGKQCTVKRTITWPDGRSKTEKFVSTYPMYQKIIEVGTGTTTTTTTTRARTTSDDQYGGHRVLGAAGTLLRKPGGPPQPATSHLVVRAVGAGLAESPAALDHVPGVLHFLATLLTNHSADGMPGFVFVRDGHHDRGAGEQLFVGPPLPELQRIVLAPGVRNLRSGSHSDGAPCGQIDEGGGELSVVHPLQPSTAQGHPRHRAHGVAGAAVHLHVDNQVPV